MFVARCARSCYRAFVGPNSQNQYAAFSVISARYAGPKSADGAYDRAKGNAQELKVRRRLYLFCSPRVELSSWRCFSVIFHAVL